MNRKPSISIVSTNHCFVIVLPKASDTKIKELDRKLGTIMSRLETIEKILSDSLEHPELASTISNLRAGVLLVTDCRA